MDCSHLDRFLKTFDWGIISIRFHKYSPCIGCIGWWLTNYCQLQKYTSPGADSVYVGFGVSHDEEILGCCMLWITTHAGWINMNQPSSGIQPEFMSFNRQSMQSHLRKVVETTHNVDLSNKVWRPSVVSISIVGEIPVSEGCLMSDPHVIS